MKEQLEGYSPTLIAALIRDAGWTQARLAEILGISRAAVSYTVQTGANPKLASLISRLLGVPAGALWPHRPNLRPEVSLTGGNASRTTHD